MNERVSFLSTVIFCAFFLVKYFVHLLFILSQLFYYSVNLGNNLFYLIYYSIFTKKIIIITLYPNFITYNFFLGLNIVFSPYFVKIEILVLILLIEKKKN